MKNSEPGANLNLMHYSASIFLFIASNLSAQPIIENTTQGECVRISRIHLKPGDIFQDYSHASFVKSSLDFLHHKTQPSVLEKELLFKQGDCFDQALIEETERNLRALVIFSFVDITAEHNQQGVDVTVTTQDKWTLRLEVTASQKGSQTKSRFSFGEKNIFGLNKQFHYSQFHTSSKDTKNRLAFSDPRIFYNHAIDFLYETVDNRVAENYTFAKPFRSLSDRYSYSFNFGQDNLDSIYPVANGSDINVPKTERSEASSYSRELGSPELSRRIGVNLSHTNLAYFPERADELIPDSVYIPEDLETVALNLHYDWQNRGQFLLLSGVDSLVSQEDISLKQSASAGIGGEWRNSHNDARYHNTFSLGWGVTELYEQQFLSSFQVTSNTRFYAGKLREMTTNAFYHGYYFLSSSQSYVGAMTYSYQQSRDELNLPLSLGVDMGLRGHDVGALTGNKRLILNLEHRYRFPVKSKNIAFGQSLFIDAGYAWPHQEQINLKDLEVDIGWGLRMNLPSLLGKKLLRFDLGMSLATFQPIVSITVGQVFSYDEISAAQSKDF